MKTANLKGLNAARTLRESELEGTRLREIFAVGTQGSGDSGARGHLLFVEEVIEPGQSGRQAGDVFAARAACNSQKAEAVLVEAWDLKDVSCTKCQKILDRIRANLRTTR